MAMPACLLSINLVAGADTTRSRIVARAWSDPELEIERVQDVRDAERSSQNRAQSERSRHADVSIATHAGLHGVDGVLLGQDLGDLTRAIHSRPYNQASNTRTRLAILAVDASDAKYQCLFCQRGRTAVAITFLSTAEGSVLIQAEREEKGHSVLMQAEQEEKDQQVSAGKTKLRGMFMVTATSVVDQLKSRRLNERVDIGPVSSVNPSSPAELVATVLTGAGQRWDVERWREDLLLETILGSFEVHGDSTGERGQRRASVVARKRGLTARRYRGPGVEGECKEKQRSGEGLY
ncbi:uncharacterized protein MKK02DRAFT_29594 [Dioszegia hungarica]|uniref:Uncharacterized protein n=1 Tax=Dioszegia hungarica TaxID=4972 RepID=A0AA38LXC8_9TREE|nr:uncharacterized protein MKK02DRAFT_29594 [Dioszegia hungarica]KAI9639555.1 hypothetical protein MKK02DRAFT_29594 [Dioszegia hungarica]